MEAKIIGNKIAKARKEKTISQADLARQLFISPQAVGKWERGESVPDIIMMNRLSKILGVDLNYFSENFESVRSEGTHKVIQDIEVKNGNIPEQELLTNFNGSNLAESDFIGVTAHKRKFNGSNLQGADFSGADLTGSAFTGSDAQDATFDKTNLTDCTLFAINLTDTSFKQTVLIRTEFSAADLSKAKFTDVEFIDVQMNKMDLRKTVFENCSFKGVVFKSSDLSGVSFDGLIFTNVKFDGAGLQKTTFKGATLRNVSFQSSFALTNKFYRGLKTINFEEARMDKLTYASLKGLGVDMSGIIII